MKVVIIQERKNPPDSRVALAPDQAQTLISRFPTLQIDMESSPNRCYNDEAYRQEGFSLTPNIEEADILIGIKEVPIESLIPNKTYFFFSHTTKKQPYNRKLLQAILEKNITLIDYESLTDENGQRLVAFGIFAGMVGAHNGLWAFAQKHGHFYLPRMHTFANYAEAKTYYKERSIPPMKVVVTGTGRVASGAVLVLKDMGFRQVSAEEYLKQTFDEPVFTQLSCQNYVQRKDGKPFDKKLFYNHPEEYQSSFAPFLSTTDIMINGIYYDDRAPAFFTLEEMQSNEFKIQVIADVTCDIAPHSSIPSTLEASTIADPVFGFSAIYNSKMLPHKGDVDMMTIDNLPNELPQDASRHFGDKLIEFIIPELMGKTDTEIIHRATVTKGGKLTPKFAYLQDYVDGK